MTRQDAITLLSSTGKFEECDRPESIKMLTIKFDSDGEYTFLGGSNQYVAKIHGTDPKFGLERAFITQKKNFSSSRKNYTCYFDRSQVVAGDLIEIQDRGTKRYHLCTGEGFEYLGSDR